jgi:hypothetical protein
MRLTWRDILATVFVFAAALLYSLWLAGIEVFGIGSARVLGGVILVLGLAASVSAVVYGVGAGLLQVRKAYLVIASVVGLVALVAGVTTLAADSETMLGVLMISTVVLWVMSTIRHASTTKSRGKHVQSPLPFGHAA